MALFTLLWLVVYSAGFFDFARHVGMLFHTPFAHYYLAGSFDFRGTLACLLTHSLLGSHFAASSTLAALRHAPLRSLGVFSIRLVLRLYLGTLACSHHSFGYSSSMVVLGFSARFWHVGMLTIVLSNASFYVLAFSQIVFTMGGILAPILGLVGKPTVRLILFGWHNDRVGSHGRSNMLYIVKRCVIGGRFRNY